MDAKGWILCQCTMCGHLNYVEPHGTDAECRGRKCRERTRLGAAYESVYGVTRPYTEHVGIPAHCCDFGRLYVIRKPNLKSN